MADRIIQIFVKVDDAAAEAKLKGLGTTAETTSAKMGTAFRRSNTALKAAGDAAQSLGRMMTGVGGGMLLAGGYAVKTAMDFQTAMTRIQTQAGATHAQVDSLSKGILNLQQSGKVQFGSTDLANALYHIESVAAGTFPALRHTSTAMKVLQTAATGAAVGGSNLEDTTSALMGALFATRAPLSDVNHMMGLINATVGAGNMRLQDLTLALGRGVIPAFREVGLRATDAFAALALLSDSGVHASSAAAQLGTALHFLAKPSTEADKFLASIGMTTTQMAADMHKPKGLLVALQDLHNGLVKFYGSATSPQAEQTVLSVLPGGRGRILLTLLQNLDRYDRKIKDIYAHQNDLNAASQAQSHTLSGQLHIAWSKINGDLTKFGTTLIPIVAKYVPPFLSALEGILKWFTLLPTGVKKFMVELAAFMTITGPIIWFFGKWISMISKLLTMFQTLKGALQAILKLFKTEEAENVAAQDLTPGGGALSAWKERHPEAAAAKDAEKEGEKLGKFAKFAKGVGTVGKALPFISTGIAVAEGLKMIADMNPPSAREQRRLRNVGQHSGHLSAGGVVARHYAYGGPVFGDPLGSDNIPAWLSAGEGVLNRTAMSGIGVGGLAALNAGGVPSFGAGTLVASTPITINVDGKVLARAVLQQTLRRAARGPSNLVGGQLVTGSNSLGT